MPMDDLYIKPGHLIRRMQQIAVAIFVEECADFDLTSVQYASLVGIRENPGIDATRLSSVIFFDRATLGNVLERLESKGLIYRTGRPGDKRIKVLNLTDMGRKVLNDVTPFVERAQVRMLETLAEPDRAKLIDLLKGLVASADATSRDLPPVEAQRATPAKGAPARSASSAPARARRATR